MIRYFIGCVGFTLCSAIAFERLVLGVGLLPGWDLLGVALSAALMVAGGRTHED